MRRQLKYLWPVLSVCLLSWSASTFAQNKETKDEPENYLPHPSIRAYYPNLNNCAKLDIITPEGKKLPEFLFDNQKWVEGTKGKNYIIRIQNNCQTQVYTVLTVAKTPLFVNKKEKGFVVDMYDAKLVDKKEGEKLVFDYPENLLGTPLTSIEAIFYERKKELAPRAENEGLNESDFKEKPLSTSVVVYDTANNLLSKGVAKEDELLKFENKK